MEKYILLPSGYPEATLGLYVSLCYKSCHSNHTQWYKFCIIMLESTTNNWMIPAIFLLTIYEWLQSNSSSKASMMFHPNYVDQMTSLAMNVQYLSSRNFHQNRFRARSEISASRLRNNLLSSKWPIPCLWDRWYRKKLHSDKSNTFKILTMLGVNRKYHKVSLKVTNSTKTQ